MESAEIKTTFVTPAIVNFPVFKGKPTRLFVECVAGDKTLKKTITPRLHGTAVGGPSAAGLIAAIITSAIVAAKDQWSYSLPQLVLEAPKAGDA